MLKRPADELIQFMSLEPMEQEIISLQAELYELKKSIYTISKMTTVCSAQSDNQQLINGFVTYSKKRQVPKFPFCCKVKHVSGKKPLLVVCMNSVNVKNILLSRSTVQLFHLN